MKAKTPHQLSVSKPKQEKPHSKSRHQGSMSNTKHKVSQMMEASQSKKLSMKTQASNSKSRGRPQKSKELKKGFKEKRLKTKSKRSEDITHIQSREKAVSNTNTNTDRRKLSIKTTHKTEVNGQEADISTQIALIRNSICKLVPHSSKADDIRMYYESIRKAIGNGQNQLGEMLRLLHDLYIAPILQFLEQIQPYENLIFKKKDINQQIESQIQQNKQLYQQIISDSEKIQISRLQAIVLNQRKQIEQRRKFINQELSCEVYSEEILETQVKRKEFKIDLGVLKTQKPVSYHDEFMSHLAEMSESWRNQINRQKRY